MKTHLLPLLLLLFSLQFANGQIDEQWLIWNNFGKNGLNPTGNQNKYEFEFGSSLKFNLQGVSLPNVTISPRARNDVFIIYSNGDHFNSWHPNMTGQGFFYNAGDAQNGVTTHNFIINGNLKIGYMYLSNIYDGDDLPERVKSQTGFATGPSAPPYPVGTTVSPILSSDHDIVMNTDITVIINYDSLITPPDIGIPTDLVLTFNKLVPKDRSPSILDNNILKLEPIFKYSSGTLPGFPEGTFRDPGSNNGTVVLTPGTAAREHYGYINFKPTTMAYQRYGPDVNGNPTHSLIFSILKNNHLIREYSVDLRASHDPNFLRVDSICVATDNSSSVFYHLEFENVSETAANRLKAEITFPPDIFDPGCMKITKWYAGGAVCSGRVSNSGRTYTFEFSDNNPITRCPDEFADVCKGYVEFRVKVNSAYPLIGPHNTSLKLDDPKVFFDGKAFPLERFYDNLEYKGTDLVRDIQDGHCDYCPPPSPPLCIPCIIAAIVAVIGVALFFALRRRRSQ